MMFRKPCEEAGAHSAHTYTQHWRKIDLLYLRDSHLYPSEWDAAYICPGIVSVTKTKYTRVMQKLVLGRPIASYRLGGKLTPSWIDADHIWFKWNESQGCYREHAGRRWLYLETEVITPDSYCEITEEWTTDGTE